jgi:CheY-like chemotaxis protein
MPNAKTILVADDDPNDVFLVKAAFSRAGYDFPFLAVTNGEEVLNYLKGLGKYANRNRYPIPTLLLLDIKMPGMDGFEVLRWIRSHPEWRALPVIVLTNSCFGPDINMAYNLGADSFLTKPEDSYSYVGAVKQVAHFWLVQNSFPELGPFVNIPEVETESSNCASPALNSRQLEHDNVLPLRSLPTSVPENVAPESPSAA